MKTFAITATDLLFINQQVNVPLIKILRYTTTGIPIYGYTNPTTKLAVELGQLDTFDLMTSSWAQFIPNDAIITNTNTSPFGMRNINGYFNNLTAPNAYDWGSTGGDFARVSYAKYDNYSQQLNTSSAFTLLNQVAPSPAWGSLTENQKAALQDKTDYNVTIDLNGHVDLSARYENPFLTVYDYTPRMISQTVDSYTALNRIELNNPGVITDHFTYQLFDPITKKPTVGAYFVASAVNLTDNTIDLRTSNTTFSVGDGVVYFNGGGTSATGLTSGSTYYVASTATSGIFKLSDTEAHAKAGTNIIDITGQGNDAQYLLVPTTENFIRNLNTLSGDPSLTGWNVLFGQFFDHGLDSIGKGGNTINGVSSKVYIPLDPSDPLYLKPGDAGYYEGVNYLSISRATVSNAEAAGADGMFGTADDIQSPGVDGIYRTADDIVGPTDPMYVNHTSPYIDQSQTYGSNEQITSLLREWVLDPVSGTYIPGMKLFDGTTLAQAYNRQNPDGTVTATLDTLPTLNELRKYLLDTGRDDLSWGDISNLRARGADGKILDLDPNTDGIQALLTGATVIGDMLPRIDFSHVLGGDPLSGATGHTIDLLAGFGFNRATDLNKNIADGGSTNDHYLSDYIDLITGTPTALGNSSPDILGEILLRSIGDHYIAGDPRANENFGLTAMHHVWHENHNWQIDNLISSIEAAQTAAGPTSTYASQWQIDTGYKDDLGNFVTTYLGHVIAWDQEKMFQAALFINQMEYQHVAIDQYARGLTPNIPLFFMYDSSVNADVTLEYSQGAFRFGHSQLRETIDALDPNGSLTAAVNHYALEKAFLNPAGFESLGPAAIALGMTRQIASELDQFVTPALQQNLLGQKQDLAAINIARGRDLGIPTLNDLRAAISNDYQAYIDTLNAALLANPTDATLQQTIEKMIGLKAGLNPYHSWNDFQAGMQTPEGLATFIAAYSLNGNIDAAEAIVGLANYDPLYTFSDISINSPSVKTALESIFNIHTPISDTAWNQLAANFLGSGDGSDTGFNQIDAWNGGLAEKHVFLGQMGATFDAIFCDQMTRLINGDRDYYFWRLQDGLITPTQLINSITNEQFSDIISRTTGAQHLNGNVMFYADSYLEFGQTPSSIISGAARQHQYGDLIDAVGNVRGVYSIFGKSEAGNGTDRVYNGNHYILDIRPDSATLNPDGTTSSGFNSHEVLGGTKNNDYIDAGDGDDTIWLGDGNDIGMGNAGADHIYGEAGNDTLMGGELPDFLDGGAGNDVIDGGNDVDVLIGAEGNDSLYGGAGIDVLSGDAGDDYLDGGTEGDTLLAGEGSDIAIGGEGVDIVQGQWGDDQLFGGAGPDQLFGDAGDDILHGGTGAGNLTLNVDEALGQEGFDLVSFTDVAQSLNLVADLNFQNINVVGQQTALVTPFGQLWITVEGIEGGAFADQIIGDAGSNWLIGGGNNDILSGGVGDDVIVGDAISLATLNQILDALDITGASSHFKDLQRAYPNFNLGDNVNIGATGITYSAPINGTSDTVTYRGSALNFKFTPIVNPNILDPNYGTVIGIRIVDQTGVETSAFGDLVFGVEKFVFGYDFETTVANAVTPHAFINPSSLSEFTTFTFDQIAGNPLPNNQFALNHVAAAGSIAGASSPGMNKLDANLMSIFSSFGVTASYRWEQKTAAATTWTTIATQNGSTLDLSVGTWAAGNNIRQVVTYTDLFGTVHTIYSNPTDPIGSAIVGTVAADNRTATANQDLMYGGLGNDTLNGGAGNDLIYGDEGNDSLVGGTGNDTMYGGAGNDTYTLDTASDVVIEDELLPLAPGVLPGQQNGIDTVLAGVSYILGNNLENLTLTGTTAINATGNALNNVLVGNSGANIINGFAGDDTITGAAGNDTMDGGDGSDTYVLTTSSNYSALEDIIDTGLTGTDRIVISNTATGSVNFNATLSGVEQVWIGVLAPLTNLITTTGTTTVNVNALLVADNLFIQGNDGINAIVGGTGLDTINGGAGNDTITGNNGNDILTGGLGIDRFVVDLGIDTVTDLGVGGAESFAVSLGAKINATLGAAWTASATVGATTSNAGSALINANNFSVSLASAVTTAGNFGYTIRNTNSLGTFLTTGVALTGSGLSDTITGGTAADTITGGAGTDNLIGGDGNDIFIVALAADHTTTETITGGNGTTDEIRFTSTVANATLTLSNLVSGVENITIATGTAVAGGATAITALNINASALGYGVNITGNAGANILTSGSGYDTLTGGLGNDTYVINSILDTVVETSTLATEIDTVQSSVNYTLGANVENLTLIGTASTATGNALSNTLTGNGSNNTLDGGAGVDILVGGSGNDTYIVDLLATGLLQDTVTETSALVSEIDTIQLRGSLALATTTTVAGAITLGANIENLDASGVTGSAGLLNLVGNTLANTITGSSGNDVITGGAGTDNLIGGDGNDIFIVALAADHTTTETITGGNGTTDEIRFTSTVANATLTLSNLVSGVENITIGTGTGAAAVTTATTALNINGAALTYAVNMVGNAGANILTSGSGYDTLTGGAGADILIGGGGNDTLIGGTGNDNLTGGTGNDVFLFNSAPGTATTPNIDTITDFNNLTEQDKINLSAATFGSIAGGVAGNMANEFMTTTLAITSPSLNNLTGQHFIYNTASGALYYDATSGLATDAVQIGIIGVTNHPGLSASDFAIV